MFYTINDEQTPDTCPTCGQALIYTPLYGWICRKTECREKNYLAMVRQMANGRMQLGRKTRQEERDYDLGDWSKEDNND